MKRGDYIRLTVHPKPWGLNAPLSVLTLISEQVSVMEGWLTGHILDGGEIRLVARIKDGELVQGTYTSKPILSIQGQYVETHNLIYQVLKVSPSRPGDTFAEFA